jgi:two-component sensor histidine kinase
MVVHRRSSSIRLHLAVFGLLVILPLIAVGAFVSQRIAAYERVNLERTVRNLPRDLADAVDRELEGAKAALFALATSPYLDATNFEGLYGQAQRVVKSFPGSVIVLRDAERRQLMVTSVPWGTALSQTSDPVLLEADEKAVASKTAVVSDMFTGATTGQRFLAVEIPIERDGRVAYLLTLALRPERILGLLQARSIDSAWIVGIVDGHDRVIVRTRDHERYVGTPASPEFVAHAVSEEGSFVGRTFDGIPVLTVYMRSRLSGWRIAAAIPLATLEAPLRRSYIATGSMAAIGLLVSIILAIMYGRYITGSVNALQRLAAAGGRGEKVSSFVTGTRELDRVADALAAASSDISEREKKQTLLINELNHRVKNTLATIQSIAVQTIKNSDGLKDFRKAFEGRLMALSNSHNALTTTNWSGAKIEDLLLDACRPFCDVRTRIAPHGEPIELPPRAAVLWGMIFHELATNAAKYGALSNPDGIVHVVWSNPWEDGRSILHFEWKEKGGPATAAPARKGFGSTLILSGIEHDLGGQAQLGYETDGLRFKAIVPLDR